MGELKQWNDLYGEGGSRKKQQLTYFLQIVESRHLIHSSAPFSLKRMYQLWGNQKALHMKFNVALTGKFQRQFIKERCPKNPGKVYFMVQHIFQIIHLSFVKIMLERGLSVSVRPFCKTIVIGTSLQGFKSYSVNVWIWKCIQVFGMPYEQHPHTVSFVHWLCKLLQYSTSYSCRVFFKNYVTILLEGM